MLKITPWIYAVAILSIGAGDAAASPTYEVPVIRQAVKRPPPEEQPTTVWVGVYLIDLNYINEQERTFRGDFIVQSRWQDERLADAAAPHTRIVALDDIWNPRLLAVNRRDAKALLPPVAEVAPDGHVLVVQRYVGSATIPLSFVEFPFDKQWLFLEVVSRGYGPTEVVFATDPNRLGRAETINLSGWYVGRLAVRPITMTLNADNGKLISELSGFRMEIEATRNRRYYALREILPLAFIVLMSSAIFWLPVKENGLKVGISTAAIFSLMAFYVHLGRSLPRIDYLTRMDLFVVGSTCLVFMAFIQVVFGMFLVKRELVEQVESLDVWARLVYPMLFIGNLCLSFYLPRSVV